MNDSGTLPLFFAKMHALLPLNRCLSLPPNPQLKHCLLVLL
jgi:hypothetical protein